MLAAGALLAAAVSWASPRAALLLLLTALPFATHHASSAPAVLLLVLAASFVVGYVFRTRPSPAGTIRAVAQQPLLLLLALFGAAAWLSLTSLPLASIWREHRAVLGVSGEPWPLASHALGWLLLSEGRREVSITAACMVAEAFALALIVFREGRASDRMALRMAAAVAAGTAIAVTLGLLEAFGVISLEAFRGDGTGSVLVRSGSLQSVAGNPGWFSQYLVYTLPYALVVLAGGSAMRLRGALFAALAAVTTLALLVSFQRGGWVAGIIVLAYLAMTAPRSLSLHSVSRPGGWRTVGAAVLLVALVAGGFAVWIRNARPGGAPFDASVYLWRLQTIVSGDRLPYAQAGIRIATLHPILGGGHESFAHRYGLYFDRPGGPFVESGIRVPEPASAHNVYLQTLTGTGAVGLVLLLSLFVVSGLTAVRIARDRGLAASRRVVVAAAAGSLLGMAVYGLVQEIFYVHALRLLFFVAIALVASAGRDAVRWTPRIGRVLWLLLGVAFVAHLLYEYGWPGPSRLLSDRQPTGLYAERPAPDGEPVWWTADRAAWPATSAATRFSLRARSMAPYAQTAVVRACGAPAVHTTLSHDDWTTIDLPLTGCAPGDHVQVEVTPAWSPPNDFRTLGVLVMGGTVE